MAWQGADVTNPHTLLVGHGGQLILPTRKDFFRAKSAPRRSAVAWLDRAALLKDSDGFEPAVSEETYDSKPCGEGVLELF